MSLAHNSALHSIKVTLVGASPGGSDIQKKLREKDNDCCANDANRGQPSPEPLQRAFEPLSRLLTRVPLQSEV